MATMMAQTQAPDLTILTALWLTEQATFILQILSIIRFARQRSLGGNYVVTTIAGRAGIFGSADGTNNGAQFNNPGGIAMDRLGNLYVADPQDHTIRKLTRIGSNWIVTTIAGLAKHYGSADGTNSDARFFSPFSVAVDDRENLFVADYENSTIREIVKKDTNWVVTTIAGLAQHSGYADGTNTAARFDHPRALAVDKVGNIFVDDSGTDTIRMIKQVGTNYVVQTIIGLPWRWGYANGTGSGAQFDSASGIAIDKAGNIYLSDTGNNTIRQIVPPPSPKTHLFLFVCIASLLALLIGFFVWRKNVRH
jgi:hypothetical protein